MEIFSSCPLRHWTRRRLMMMIMMIMMTMMMITVKNESALVHDKMITSSDYLVSSKYAFVRI